MAATWFVDFFRAMTSLAVLECCFFEPAKRGVEIAKGRRNSELVSQGQNPLSK